MSQSELRHFLAQRLFSMSFDEMERRVYLGVMKIILPNTPNGRMMSHELQCAKIKYVFRYVENKLGSARSGPERHRNHRSTMRRLSIRLR